MKIKSEHYNQLKDQIEKILKSNPGILQSYQDKKLSSMRFRWDLYHAITSNNRKLSNDLYQYLTDDNIDTALKSITSTK